MHPREHPKFCFFGYTHSPLVARGYLYIFSFQMEVPRVCSSSGYLVITTNVFRKECHDGKREGLQGMGELYE